jgi:hypothetical protein
MFKHTETKNQRWASLLATTVFSLMLVACGEGSGTGGPVKSMAPAAPVYTMIFDAGSSGTRISFFKVIPGAYPQIALLASEDFDDNGINDFLNSQGTIDPTDWAKTGTTLPVGYQPAGCNMSATTSTGGAADVGPCVIQPLLDAMKPKMEENKVTADQVKLELFATAGMRTMEKFNGGTFDEAQIKAFYDNMKSYVQGKGFQVGQFMTSNGNKQEGVWTWVNLNDQYYNAFGGNDVFHKDAPETRGNFEVGGSSMQVAFPTTMPASDANNVYTVSINGRTYNVFSKTYLGLGGDDARKFMRAHGYSNAAAANYSGLDCFGSNALPNNSREDSGVALFNAPAIFPDSKTAAGNGTGNIWSPVLSNSAADSPLVLKAAGKYNFKTCAKKYDDVTKAVMALPRNNNGTNFEGAASSYADLVAKVAQSSAPFVGLDNFYFATKDLGLVTGDQIKTPITESKVAAAIAAKCPDNGPGPVTDDKSRLKKLRVCADAAFMYNFLWQDKNSGSSALFAPGGKAVFDGVVPNKVSIPIKQTALTWTRGYLLLEYSKGTQK